MSTALLLIDLQNDFFGEGGFINLPSEELVLNISRAIKNAREKEWKIIWIHSIYGENELELSSDLDNDTYRGYVSCCKRGSHGSKFFKPFEKMQDLDKDVFCVKHYYSAFKNSMLKSILDENNITNLIVAGVTIKTCVYNTILDAVSLNYNTSLIRDCTLAKSDVTYTEYLNKISKICDITTSYELQKSEFKETIIVNNSRLYENVIDFKNVFYELKQEVKWSTMTSQVKPVPRLVSIQISNETPGIIPIYRHPADAQPKSEPFTPLVKKLRDITQSVCGLNANHALIQYYRNGSDNIGEHSDKTLDIKFGTNIVNLSFGATREMTLKSKKPDVSGEHTYYKFSLPNDSLFVLDELTNRDFYHSIRSDKRPKSVKPDDCLYENEGRISITFREIDTFQSENLIFGQGSPYKTFEEAQLNNTLVSNEQLINEELKMLKCFSQENHMTHDEFDWNTIYGKGFSVIDLRHLNKE